MTYPLCVIAPQVGALSETFIRKHMQDLLPGKTVVVANVIDGPYGGHWAVDCPVLVTSKIRPGLRRRAVHAVARRFGLQPPDPVISQVRQFLKEHGVQVVLGEYLDMSLRWLELLQDMGIRFFAHAHGYDVSVRLRDERWRTEYLRYRKADGVIAVSRLTRERLVGLGLDPAKLHVIPCGVDVPCEPLSRVPRADVRCLSVGRMVTKKAPIFTLDAFRRAVDQCPSIRLDYIGTGELLPAARQYVQAFDLEDRVTLLGGQSSEVVQEHLRGSDIFIQHSVTDADSGDEEGLPVGIVEAMATGLPVVSTLHAGIPEAVVDGVTGYLVDEGDTRAMATRIAALAADPGLRLRMGEAGWQRAQGLFSWERSRSALLRVLCLEAHAS